MRITTLSYSNAHTQGVERRAWLQQYAPQHLQHSKELVELALRERGAAASRSSVVLGAGACTEVPLPELLRASDEVVLVDLDLPALKAGVEQVTAPSFRRKLRLVEADISGSVSNKLQRLLGRYDWPGLVAQGAGAVFDAAAQCLESCPIPDPPSIQTLYEGGYGLVVSSLVLSQLFSYPLLDVLDHVQNLAPAWVGEQERHRRYQEAAQAFRVRVINAHLHLLQSLLDHGGVAVLLSDVRGFAFTVYGTDHDAAHRRVLPLVPRVFPDLVHSQFDVVKELQWEWITDLPSNDRPGRGYEVTGYILR